VLAGRFVQFAPVTLLLLIVPVTWTVRDTEELTKRDTREVAAAVAYNRFDPVALDASLLPSFLLSLRLPARWDEPDTRRDVGALRERGFRFVAVNGEVRERVLAARDVYPEDAAFYDALARNGRRAWRLEPGERFAGPEVEIFRLPSSP
jgi:hypothetical protein